jgi:hypothetical protein
VKTANPLAQFDMLAEAISVYWVKAGEFSAAIVPVSTPQEGPPGNCSRGSSPRHAPSRSNSANFTETPEFQRGPPLSGGPNDLAALNKFLATGAGPKGASAIQALTDAASLRYGGAALLIGALKDTVRRAYIDQVAPNGLVDTAAHARFMGPQRFGPSLAHPTLADVKAELDAAGASGRKP